MELPPCLEARGIPKRLSMQLSHPRWSTYVWIFFLYWYVTLVWQEPPMLQSCLSACPLQSASSVSTANAESLESQSLTGVQTAPPYGLLSEQAFLQPFSPA